MGSSKNYDREAGAIASCIHTSYHSQRVYFAAAGEIFVSWAKGQQMLELFNDCDGRTNV